MKPRRPNFRPKISTGRYTVTKSKPKQINKELYGEDWEQISDYVRKRDNYTCQIAKISTKFRCGVQAPPPFHHLLQTHHILPLPKGSNHPTNLICLCVDCHGKLHNKNLGKITDKQRKYVDKGFRNGKN